LTMPRNSMIATSNRRVVSGSAIMKPHSVSGAQ
jgi:hypothetical protein